MRRGGACYLLSRGKQYHEIQLWGRWESNAALGYLEKEIVENPMFTRTPEEQSSSEEDDSSNDEES